ncbi:circumsporozoite protein-like [Rosa chinensis]|uniref:circumsporozoite protein-like n=1 Tax=Rosa chinensis TaxID=74649 RepID=UPI000D08DD9B|nr:circumsporozoite protein-like [Rosa chinensis]
MYVGGGDHGVIITLSRGGGANHQITGVAGEKITTGARGGNNGIIGTGGGENGFTSGVDDGIATGAGGETNGITGGGEVSTTGACGGGDGITGAGMTGAGGGVSSTDGGNDGVSFLGGGDVVTGVDFIQSFPLIKSVVKKFAICFSLKFRAHLTLLDVVAPSPSHLNCPQNEFVINSCSVDPSESRDQPSGSITSCMLE